MKFLSVQTVVRLANLNALFALKCCTMLTQTGVFTAGAAFAHAATMSSFSGIEEQHATAKVHESSGSTRRCVSKHFSGTGASFAYRFCFQNSDYETEGDVRIRLQEEKKNQQRCRI
jgi:hypothetical protein